MDIKTALSKGIPVPKAIVIAPASVDPEGKLHAGIGYVDEAGNKTVLLVERHVGGANVAEGLAAIANGIRAQVGAGDDTPYELSMPEVAQVLLDAALGKRS